MTLHASPVGFHDARSSAPVPAEGAVDRPRLTHRIAAAVRSAPLVVVVGPSGTGKTSAVAMWSTGPTPEGIQVCWASMDAADADPRRFWLTVVGALQSVLDAPAIQGLAVPARPGQDFVDRLASVLVALSTPVVLVLDDLHELDEDRARVSVEQLRRALPGQHRLLLISRHDPPLRLQRMRLAGTLAEIRTAELAFTRAEAVELLDAARLDLPPEVVDHLMATTEGWAAGLRLAIAAVDPDRDPADVVRRFGGRTPLATAYLLEEVVGGLGAERVEVLLRTSVVDRVCAPLAYALTDRPDAGEVLERLVSDQVLVSALEDTGWYRYHPMLLDMLRARLTSGDPTRATDLHRRAQRWFEDAGEWLEALAQSVRAGDEQLAAQLALRSAAVLAFTPERARLTQSLLTLSASPAHPDDAERQLCRALAHYGTGDDEATLTWLRWAGQGLDVLPEPRRRIATTVLQMLLAAQSRRLGDPVRMRTAAQAALTGAEAVPAGASPVLPQLRVVAMSLLGAAELWLGHQGEAEELLRGSTLETGEGVLDPSVAAYHEGLVALSESLRGQVRRGRIRSDGILEAARVSGWSQAHESGAAWLARAVTGLHSAEVHDAERSLALARRTRIELRDPFLGAVMDLVGARSALAGGDLRRARRTLAEVDRWVLEHPGLTLVSVMCGCLGVQIELAAGLPEVAAAVLADLDRTLTASGDAVDVGQGHVPLVRGHVHLATGRPRWAQEVVEPLLQAGGAVSAEAWLITALAQDRLRQDASAMESLAQALGYGAAEDAVQCFLHRGDRLAMLLRRHVAVLGGHEGFVVRVLALGEGPGGLSREPAAEAARSVVFTERELSVLAYLPTLSTNVEIGDQLNISVNTVKQHLKSINRKLEVGTRREAVRAARRRGLLSDPS